MFGRHPDDGVSGERRNQRAQQDTDLRFVDEQLLPGEGQSADEFRPFPVDDVLERRVELLEANHNYTVIKDSRGTTRTVSTEGLAPVTERVTE